MVSPAAEKGKDISVAVYLDGKQVYLKEGITESSAPIALDVDVTGAKSMRIETNNKGSFGHGWIRLVQTRLKE